MILRCAGVYQHPYKSWSITLQPLGVDQATIPHMKGDIHSFHIRHISLTSYGRLQRKITWRPLPFSSLVKAISSLAVSKDMYQRIYSSTAFCDLSALSWNVVELRQYES